MQKTIIHFIFLFTIAFSFFSCKSDSPISSNNSREYYNWTVINSPSDTITDISMGEDQSLFIAGRRNFRVINGISEQLNFGTSFFYCTDVEAFDRNYAVFLSGSTLRIFDKDTIRTYSLEFSSEPIRILLEDRNKFYAYSIGWNKYYLFENEHVTSFIVTGMNFPFLMGKSGSSIYAFTGNTNGYISYRPVYKITSAGPVQIHEEEPYSGSYYFTTGNNIMRINNPYGIFNYYSFNDTGWVPTFNLVEYAFVGVTGPSTNNLIGFYTDNIHAFQARVWNGLEFIEQTNFPQGLVYDVNSYPILSEFKNSSFYFYPSKASGKILKAVLK